MAVRASASRASAAAGPIPTSSRSARTASSTWARLAVTRSPSTGSGSSTRQPPRVCRAQPWATASASATLVGDTPAAGDSETLVVSVCGSGRISATRATPEPRAVDPSAAADSLAASARARTRSSSPSAVTTPAGSGSTAAAWSSMLTMVSPAPSRRHATGGMASSTDAGRITSASPTACGRVVAHLDDRGRRAVAVGGDEGAVDELASVQAERGLDDRRLLHQLLPERAGVGHRPASRPRWRPSSRAPSRNRRA